MATVLPVAPERRREGGRWAQRWLKPSKSLDFLWCHHKSYLNVFIFCLNKQSLSRNAFTAYVSVAHSWPSHWSLHVLVRDDIVGIAEPITAGTTTGALWTTPSACLYGQPCSTECGGCCVWGIWYTQFVRSHLVHRMCDLYSMTQLRPLVGKQWVLDIAGLPVLDRLSFIIWMD